MMLRNGSLSPYEILGVPPNASRAEIRAAFCRAARMCHPDKQQQRLNTRKQLGDFTALSEASRETCTNVVLQTKESFSLSTSAGLGTASVGPRTEFCGERNNDGVSSTGTHLLNPSERCAVSRGDEKLDSDGGFVAAAEAEGRECEVVLDFIGLKRAFDALQLTESKQAIDQALLRQQVSHVTHVRLCDLTWLDDDICYYTCRCGEELPVDGKELDSYCKRKNTAARHRCASQGPPPATESSPGPRTDRTYCVDYRNSASTDVEKGGKILDPLKVLRAAEGRPEGPQWATGARPPTSQTLLAKELTHAGCSLGVDVRGGVIHEVATEVEANAAEQVLMQISCESCSMTIRITGATENA
ncbi:hypothetical protein CSUI_001713 [Cystoisospora suis]|uniref:J domain-containing protein n=1 Tax=Cystoisospora suis TaxID=483139 RepID=A0A2C6LBZ5_9APIC|nr:hypothetical protein CSUI_001713 [Cystoisospora suis]